MEGGDERIFFWVMHLYSWGRGSGKYEGHDGGGGCNETMEKDVKGKLRIWKGGGKQGEKDSAEMD